MFVCIRRVSLLFLLLTCISSTGKAQSVNINDNPNEKRITFGNATLQLTVDYGKKLQVSSLSVNNQQVISNEAGIYSSIKTKTTAYSTLVLSTEPVLTVAGHSITIQGIIYGDTSVTIHETWVFNVSAQEVSLHINRTLSTAIVAEQVALPAFVFSSMTTWDGAYQDYGGLAWFYLFNKKLDTYGVHSHSSEFFNSKTGNGLLVNITAPGQQVAMDYSRTADDRLAWSVAVAQQEMLPRFDSGTNRRRFVRDRADVWAPVTLPAGASSQDIVFSYFEANKKYDRGKMISIDGTQVSAVLNTIARIGVIDKQHFGGNSWHTPYGPICLHEQYIAQIALAINDTNYLKGYGDCLDFYRDNAIKPDGRVWARWAYTNEDMMAGEVNSKGFYEAQWGYLLDANPDYVTNVAELYDQTGDLAWVKRHKLSCEMALEWIMKRDSNDNGLVEMITDSHTQRKGSDWLDIIWASYENAFVNAKLYHALVLWSAIEKQLGDVAKEKFFSAFAEKLKTSFNKATTEGGLWDAEKKCYVHWREKDGSIHGNNMVTPVNFMAIAYGICDEVNRKTAILDAIEAQMEKENLFFWPVCMSSYVKGEGNDWQFPFPNYENGDIFLSWGALGVAAYACYKPALAVKYVKNVLARYAQDGLAFQRYGRAKQDGLGDDILSGNCLSVIGLYQAVYGLNPLYNRFYLNPHITKAMEGTSLFYNYRNHRLNIGLNHQSNSVSDGRFTIRSKADFGFFSIDNSLRYFNGRDSSISLQVNAAPNTQLSIDINVWNRDSISWLQSAGRAAGTLTYEVKNLAPETGYVVFVSKKKFRLLQSSPTGNLLFNLPCGQNTLVTLQKTRLSKIK